LQKIQKEKENGIIEKKSISGNEIERERDTQNGSPDS